MTKAMRGSACERFIMVVEFPKETVWPPNVRCTAIEICFRDDAFEELADGAKCKVIPLPEFKGTIEATEGMVEVDLEGRAYLIFENKTNRLIVLPANVPVALLELVREDVSDRN